MKAIETAESRDSRDGGVGRTITLGVGIGLVAALLAGSTIWLVVTDPVAVAEALDGGEISPLVVALASALYDALVSLLDYL